MMFIALGCVGIGQLLNDQGNVNENYNTSPPGPGPPGPGPPGPGPTQTCRNYIDDIFDCIDMCSYGKESKR